MIARELAVRQRSLFSGFFLAWQLQNTLNFHALRLLVKHVVDDPHELVGHVRELPIRQIKHAL